MPASTETVPATAKPADVSALERGYIDIEVPEEKMLFDDGIDREAIIKFLNDLDA